MDPILVHIGSSAAELGADGMARSPGIGRVAGGFYPGLGHGLGQGNLGFCPGQPLTKVGLLGPRSATRSVCGPAICWPGPASRSAGSCTRSSPRLPLRLVIWPRLALARIASRARPDRCAAWVRPSHGSSSAMGRPLPGQNTARDGQEGGRCQGRLGLCRARCRHSLGGQERQTPVPPLEHRDFAARPPPGRVQRVATETGQSPSDVGAP
jgi:hypothetical protein